MDDDVNSKPVGDQAGGDADSKARPKGVLRTIWRWLKRAGVTFLVLLLGYAALVLIGLIPVNSDFVPTEGGVEILIFSGEFHSDIILPIKTKVFDWRPEFPRGHFSADTSVATHIAIGWGERDFYLHTPTWADLKVSTACSALLMPSDTVMHVAMIYKPIVGSNVRRVRISNEQYLRMVEAIQKSFALDSDGKIQRIQGYAYSNNDAFYDGAGSYHMFRTCNCWAGEVMQAGGIKVGWFTPLPKTVFVHLPDQQ